MTALGPETLPQARAGASFAPCVRLYLFRPYDQEPETHAGDAPCAERAPSDQTVDGKPRPERPA